MPVQPVPLEVTPGVVQFASKAKNSASWRETNLVRWDNGVMEPFRGWSRIDYTDPDGNICAVLVWRDNNKVEWIAYLCDGFLYVEIDGDLYDVSPTPAMDKYSDSFTDGGYGDLDYGESDFGTPRTGAPNRKKLGPAFKLDNWGEDLLAMSSADGRLLRWSPSTPTTAAVQVPNAPSGYTFVVTPERFVHIYSPDGAINEFAWCDQEDIEDWNYADLTSKAGKNPVEPSSPVTAACNVGANGNLFFTARFAYVSDFVGLPYVWSNGDEIGEGVSPISAQSLVRAVEGAMWMTDNGLWVYNGSTINPVPCPLWNWIKSQIDWDSARVYSHAVNMVDRGEFWWFFPTMGSQKANRLVVYNYKDGIWYMGKMSRSAGFSSNFLTNPIMADELKVYRHGDSDQYPDAEEGPWAESFTLNLKQAGVNTRLHQIFPEVQGDYVNLRFSVITTQLRTPGVETQSPERSVINGSVDFDTVARDFRLRIDYTAEAVLPWGVGVIQVAASPVGGRP